MQTHWFVPAVLAALFYGVQSAYLKAVLSRANQLLVAWGIFFFSLPVYVAMLWWSGIPEVSPGFWAALAVSLTVNLIAWPLFVRALQISDISLVMPLVAFTPVFVIGVEYVLLGNLPHGLGLAGILLIVVGAYVLNLRKGMRGVFEPLATLAADRGAMYMLAVSALWSISATVEKIAVVDASPAFYLTSLACGFSLVFAVLIATRVEHPAREVRAHGLALLGAGLLTGLMAAFQMYALVRTPLVNYVISIKRAGMFVSVAVGWLVFGEKNIFFRVLGALLMIGGVVLIRMA